jgi:serine/threonine-protein kinase
MGVAYKAHDPVLGRPVVLKLKIANFFDNAQVRECFRAVSVLQHPNIEAMFELGEHDGNSYIVMEYLEGKSLGHTIRSGVSLSLLQKLNIVLQVAKALEHAHDKGIIHRAIEPENIMLMSDSKVKIVGFDVTYLTHLHVETMTRVGMFIGKVPYASPEQLNSPPVDARSDIFSLGVVLYQLLTGKLPFGAENSGEVVQKILQESPAPLSRFGVVKPMELQPLINGLLAKQRTERYQKCAKVVEDLDSIRKKLEDQPQLAEG